MRTQGVVIDVPGAEPYTARVLAKTGLPINMYLEGGSLTGDFFKISVSLADTQPISEANLSVVVRPPAPVPTTTLSLYDDGEHSDGLAGDGIYANVYTETVTTGTYEFTAKAFGTTSMGEPFTREVVESAFVAQRPAAPTVIAPPDVEAAPGSSFTAVFTVENPSNVTASYNLFFGPPEESLWADLSTVPTQVTLTAGESVQIPVSVLVPAAEVNPEFSVLSLAAANQESPVASAADFMQIRVPYAELSISVSGPPTTTPGSLIDYTVTYSNGASIPAPNVTIALDLPEQIEYVSDTLGSSVVQPDGTRQWFLGTVSENGQGSFTMNLRASSLITHAIVLSVQTGIVSGLTVQGSAAAVPDANPANNQANITLGVQLAPTALEETEQPTEMEDVFLPFIQR
jgi:uncharacterized repeat protein (TIGR01451 family)